MATKLEGMSLLKRQLTDMGLKINKTTKEKALKTGGEFLKEKLIPEIPVLTGNWKENVIVSDVKNNKVDIGVDQQGDAFYGYMFEFGTSRQPARPVYGPIFENNHDKVQDVIGTVIKKELGL
ncbi:HK97-gp10 family putative phage morphogenesis protein [Metabacillus litoralis]|uniref:HK97-gp10 family putative phage morphogenesis protein n=1 Tax=Metabacillus litoralis TaxID=152268 RepID=UPI00203C2CD5|nr:HK97-gp10 family putative phage morphogenesis protein [Metabacillus litoralis]MCM3411230.1 hypothetical protein [Metabacillus litoralis]